MDDREQHPVAFHEVAARKAGGAQEALDRLFGRVGLGALALLLAVGLGGRQAVGDQGQAARAGEGLDPLGQETGLGQALARHALQVARGLGLHARRDLFGKQFEQELGHYLRASAGRGLSDRAARVLADSAGWILASTRVVKWP